MDELVAKTPCAGALPIKIGGMTLVESDLGALTLIAPFQGQDSAVSEAMTSAHGVAFPKVNRISHADETRALWFGRGMALLAGPAADAGLSQWAAITDQTDAWACVTLSGAGAQDALARLVPVDLRARSFKRGHTIRSQIMHMNGSITRTGSDSFLLLVFRSMALTLVHDLKQAMEGVASRG